ncbi:MAG: carbon-nitrogen hydrolase family protein [Candidatus Lokiarchaeota archaeon]|nr:carbon-nitrogen hydrolase family protein [Candidatus Harpocratesius repetitus]
MAKKVKIALVQPELTHNNQENFEQIEILIKQAVQKKPDILCLPERWYHLDLSMISSKECFSLFQEERGLQYNLVKFWAKKYHISIISGGIWEKSSDFNKPVVVCYYFDENGNEQFYQRKIHLYGIEKKILNPGSRLVCFHDSKLGFTFSILICFDLHISSTLISEAIAHGSEIIFSPTLIRNDGMENWKIYLQARALEHRIPIVSCNSVYSAYGRKFKGGSKIISFIKGKTSPAQLHLSELGSHAGIMIKTVNLDFPNLIRKEREKEKKESSQISVLKLHS